MMNSKDMALVAAKALDDKKGKEIRVLEIEKLTSIADYFVICSGSSNTQINALCDCVEEKLEVEGGEKALRREGHRGGIWVLLDYGSVVIHVFNDEAREFYDLERLWNDGRNVDLTGADRVIIMLGSNGGLDPEEETQGNRDFRELLSLCRQDAPNAAIYLCTPPHATEDPRWSNCGYAPQVEKAVAFIRKIAAEMQFPLIETALCPEFTAENEDIMQPNDGLHFGEKGYETLAKFIANALT